MKNQKRKSISLFSNKKGVVTDMATIIIFGTFFAFFLVIMFGVVTLYDDAFQDDPNMSAGATRFAKFKNQFISIWDVGFFVLLMGLVIAGIVGLFIIDSHPVLFLASFIGIGVLLLIAASLSNAFVEFANSEGVNVWADEFTFIPLIMNNFVEFLVVIGGVFSVALFAKINRG